jgi:amino acid adenylation domain-containing protein
MNTTLLPDASVPITRPGEATSPEAPGVVRTAPLSPAQRGLWFIQQMDPTTSAYNVLFAGRVRSAVDRARLGASLQTLIDRHPSLRTTFHLEGGAPVQRVHAVQTARLVAVDASGWSETELETEVRRTAREPFDLGRSVFRAVLFSRGPDDHVLLIVVHHLAVDLWGIALMLEDLRRIHGGEALEPAPELSAIDYAADLSERLAAAEGERMERYWTEALGGTLPVLALPTDRPRPPVQRYVGEALGFDLGRESSDAVREIARRADTTPYVVLLTAYQLLLARYSGQDDILVGSPFFGRPKRSWQKVVGNFVNTVVLRGRVEGGESFLAHLARTRTSVMEALRYQEYPFPQLVERLQPARDPSRPAICQVAFNWEALPQVSGLGPFMRLGAPAATRLDFGGMALEPFPVPQQEGQFDLTLELGGEVDDAYFGVLKYSTDLYEEATARRFVAHYRRLLASLLDKPEAPVGDAALLGEEEREEIVERWNRTATEVRYPGGVHRLVEEQAERTPEAVAVRFGDEALSFAELEARANRLARHLARLGVGRGMRVGICLERSPEMVVALLAALKTGAAYVPLDPAYPAERIAQVLEDADLAALVTRSELIDRLPARVPPIVELDRAIAAIAAEPAGSTGVRVDPSDTAYVIFTSGSTGRPKGVVVPHGAVVNFLASMAKEPGLRAGERLLAVTTLSFDIAVLELLLPLAVGGEVVLASAAEVGDPAALRRILAEQRIDVMQATPATWRMLVEAGWEGQPGLRVLCGGEALPRDLAGALRERVAEVWNMYGPTETTVWSAVTRVEEGVGTPPVGRPIANTQLYVLDPRRQPVPVGVPGELYIGGAGVTRGYLGRPDLTAERFVPSPIDPRGAARLYRTGDLVRYRPDGRLDFLGRTDHQVKIRGFRIELGDIESALRKHPALTEVVVLAREFGGRGKELVAYFSHDGPAPSTAELRAHLGEKLSAYMVPSWFVPLDGFPLTPNGKIDRLALPSPAVERDESAVVPPRDDLELQLVQIWEEVLQVRPVGVTDSFFDLGGHSLLAVSATSLVKDRLGRELPVSALFQQPTVEGLAQLLRQEGAIEASPLVPLQPKGTRKPVFMPHPIGGNVFCYVPLLRHLDGDQPVYGLQAPALVEEAVSYIDVEDMARTYLELMREVDPHGPYYLAGWCFGGMIAFEMARQLRESGEEVALLAMFDSAAPARDEEIEAVDDATLMSWFARDLAVPVGKTLTVPAEVLRTLPGEEMFDEVLRRAKAAGVIAQDAPVAQLQRAFQVYLANGLALRDFQPGIYDGPVHYFRAAEEPGEDPAIRWQAFTTQPIRSARVPGTHNTMLYEPHVRTLADALTALLDAAG